MKRIIICGFLILMSLFGISQTQDLNFDIQFGKENLELNKWYKKGNDTIKFETIKFYVSNLQFLSNDTLVYSIPNSYYLIDLKDTTTKKISYNIPNSLEYSQLKFNLGIDSSTNYSGAMGGALDPTYGMYWTWQSGYINTKIEGESKQCLARKNYFQFHIGGYEAPFKSLQTVNLSIKNQNQIVIDFELLFSEIDLQSNHTVMSPGKKAVDFAALFSSSFKTKQ